MTVALRSGTRMTIPAKPALFGPVEHSPAIPGLWHEFAKTLPYNQRLMLAARMVSESAARKASCYREKAAWIAKARATFSPGDRRACEVCGAYADFAHAHHVYPLSAQYDDGVRAPVDDHVWLCPNHHAVVHHMISASEAVLPCSISSVPIEHRDACDRIAADAVRARMRAIR